ncbi:MAG: hypothetical protein WC521_02215 [Bdellovibrionales bacterium]
MRLTIFFILSLLLGISAVQAQSVTDNLPPVIIGGESAPEALIPAANPYTITDVKVDVTADTAAHARDQALMQAERKAFVQLCARLETDTDANKFSDDDIAALVQSFEVQNERLSAVRYIGIYTIHFSPSAVQRAVSAWFMPSAVVEEPPAPQPSAMHIFIIVQADSLPVWAQLKRRLSAIPQVVRVDTLSLKRGLINVDLSYNGSLDDLKDKATDQGLVLRQKDDGSFELYDGSMVIR